MCSKSADIMFIAIDGLDGTGKSTFCKQYVKHLKQLKIKSKFFDKVHIETYHLPDYDTIMGRVIKESFSNKNIDYRKNAKRNLTNMREFWDKHFDRWINKNGFTIVVLDRYLLSTYLYSVPFVRNRNAFAIECYNNHAMNEDKLIKSPDIQVYFNCDKDVQMKRLKRRKNKDIFEDTNRLEKINKYSEEIKSFFNDNICEVIDLPSHLIDNRYWRTESSKLKNILTTEGTENKKFLSTYFSILDEKIKEKWKKYGIEIPVEKINTEEYLFIEAYNKIMKGNMKNDKC